MKSIVSGLILWMGVSFAATAQTDGEEGRVFQVTPPDSFAQGNVIVVHKDHRIQILGRKMAEYNAAIIHNNSRTAKGFRLMLLSTNDRDLAMNIRAKLLQTFPEQIVYMSYQSPFIKLKFGNFLEKAEAEKYRAQINNLNMVPGNIYILPETIEVQPEKIDLSE